MAKRILQSAACELAMTVRDMVDHLGIARDDCACIGMGSVLARSDVYWEAFRDAVRGFAPRFQLVRVVEPLVLGFALAALDELHGVARADVQARLRETFAKQEL
ncbi:MAG: hypothetical protein N3A53_03750 [Verrucomicrobiae bacterium]|nr:hypothetical protein [Verrucomicrobiae bacterium]